MRLPPLPGSSQPFFEAHLGLPGIGRAYFACIEFDAGNVDRAIHVVLDGELFAGDGLNVFEQLHQTDRVSAGDVEGVRTDGHRLFDDVEAQADEIVDVEVIADGSSIPPYREGLISLRMGESRWNDAESATHLLMGAVEIRWSQQGGGQRELLRSSMDETFGRRFRRAIVRAWTWRHVFIGRVTVGVAIQGATRRDVEQATVRRVLPGFQQSQGWTQVIREFDERFSCRCARSGT